MIHRYKFITDYRFIEIHVISETQEEAQNKLSVILKSIYKFPPLWEDKFRVISQTTIGNSLAG